MMKLTILFLLVSLQLFAGTMPNDNYKLGKASSVLSKGFTFDTGDAASNAQLKVDDSRILNYTDSNFKLGTGTAIDSKIEFNRGGSNAYVGWSETDSAIVFSNDGTLEKKLGSGSGGGAAGFNNLDNAGFEDGITSEWTCTASRCTEVLENPPTTRALFGEKSLKFDPTTINDNFKSTCKAIPLGIQGGNCEYKATYIGGDEFLSLRVVDGNSDVVSVNPLKVHAKSDVENFFFICPNAADIGGDANKGILCLETYQHSATAPATATFDDMYLGENSGLAHTVIGGSDSVRLDVANAFGATDTKIRRFLNYAFFDNGYSFSTLSGGTIVSPNGGFKIVDSAANGTYVEILKAGNLRVAFNDNANAVSTTGLSLNSTQLTTNIASITQEDRLAISTIGGASYTDALAWNGGVKVGDIIRGHTDGTTIGDSNKVQMSIVWNPLIETQSLVYKNIPKVADNTNNMGARIVNNGTATITSQHPSNPIASVNRTADGVVDVVFTVGFFSVIPSIVASIEGTDVYDTRMTVPTTSGFTIYTANSGSAFSDSDFTLHLERQTTDVKTETTQLILVNQVETSVDVGVRSESCTFNTTSCTFVSNCSSWITSLSNIGGNICDLNVETGVFPSVPRCTYGPTTANVCPHHNGVVPTTSIIRSRTMKCSDATDLGAEITINCIGDR